MLLVGGSLNQTLMMHRIAERLEGCDARFTPFFADGLLGAAARAGLADFTILGGQARRRTEEYLRDHRLPIDERGADGPYALTVMGTDLVVPRSLRRTPIVLVQEGMMDPEDWRYHAVRRLGLPRFLANTSTTGLSHCYEVFCVASEGFRRLFVGKGVPSSKLAVTGIPNFDDVASLRDNDFPHRDYVLGVTSCLRETLKPEDRPAFIRRCREIAAERRLIFKLHPNENADRATREIRELAPEALVFAEGDTGAMVANCAELVARYSSVVFLAVALGKPVHSDLAPELLAELCPIQNGGTSADRIAESCLRLLH